jgi:lambda family phage portal protein
MSKNPPALPIPKPNLLDRALTALDPVRGARRMKARVTMALAEQQLLRGSPGAFIEDENMGGRDRPLFSWGWRPRATGPNDPFTHRTLDTRAQSRELIRTDPIAAGAINVNGAHVIGTGLTMEAAVNAAALGMSPEAARAWNEATSRRFLEWASSPLCDVSRRLDFYDLQYQALVSVLAAGDVLTVLTAPSMPSGFGLAVQLVEAERICNERNAADERGRLVQGVELDAAGGEVGYWVASDYPEGTTDGNLTWRRIPAYGASSGRRIGMLVFEQKRPGQARGIPYLAGVVEPLKKLGMYSDAELTAAVTAASLTVFTKMDPEAFELFTEDSQKAIVERGMEWDGRVRSNTAINLLPGEEVQVPENKRPNANFDPFFLAMVRQVGIGLEIPFEVLIKHFDSSYSAARAALLDGWRTFRRRRDWMAKKFCQPIYEEWLADEVAAGRIDAPGFFGDRSVRWAYSQASWIGDGPGSVDPQKDVDAAEKRMNLGLSTLQDESILHDGKPWQQKHAQRVVEVKTRRTDGLEMDPSAALAAAAPPAGKPARREPTPE